MQAEVDTSGRIIDDDALSSCWIGDDAVVAASPARIPLEVSSLADEVALQVARLHTSTIQEGKRRLPSVAVARLRAMTFWQ